MDDRLVALDHNDAKRRVEDTAELDALAHVLSHDVRAVFRSTGGFAQVVGTRAANVLSDEDRALLQRVVDASERGSDLLEQIVAWLRTARHTPKYRTVDLAFLLDWSASELPAPGLDLHVDGAAEIQGDEHLLKRLFEVLLRNARNFTADGSRPAPVQVLLRQDADGSVAITVQDAGIGIDAQSAERAFEPFVCLHTAEQGAGTGLGLAMAKSIVLKHQGSISLAPAEDGGTRVEIRLPAHTES